MVKDNLGLECGYFRKKSVEIRGGGRKPKGRRCSADFYYKAISDSDCQELLDDLSGPAAMINAFPKGGEIDLRQFLDREGLKFSARDFSLTLALETGRMAGRFF